MSRLQRSSVSFRRQGSSGHIWDDRFNDGTTENGTGTARKTAPSRATVPAALSRVASSNATSQELSTPPRNKPIRRQKPTRRCGLCVCLKPPNATSPTT
ncbi:hypothetical protein FCM35_KLT05542 [Carex littledalei]|uniref:Uncharacterized protein n=1 Tax=Carex littledalei TaxID=544730 RepID=A0A833QZ09_9POAL|nr:hypothetical protein FCM35_KLT05542 [Carex littledalei]